MCHHHADLPGTVAHVRRTRHRTLQLEADSPRRHPARLQGLGRPGRLERRLLPDPQGHHRRGHERARTAISRTAPVQHQRALVRVRQVLLRPANPRRSERTLLPHGTPLEGARPEAGGDEPRHAGQGHGGGAQERHEKVVLDRQHPPAGQRAAQCGHPVVIRCGALLSISLLEVRVCGSVRACVPGAFPSCFMLKASVWLRGF
uniref:(northern house mosquito) hypothetical protein n=1 Tax=Culex pipiens TaxID=7175 RepID=A0A8D8FTJ4_CULPI